MAPTDDATRLLIAERDALRLPVERLLRLQGIPAHEVSGHLAVSYLMLAVAAWREANPLVNEAGAVELFGAMAAEAMRAFSETCVVMSARRNLQEGKNHA